MLMFHETHFGSAVQFSQQAVGDAQLKDFRMG